MKKLIGAISVSLIVLLAFAYKPVDKARLKWMTLKEVEDMLADYSFLRVHNSYIVNLRIKNELFASLAF